MLEVHRWRGTPEQRAVRASVRKWGQFAYFDEQLGHPDWRGKKVLDFGGCDGNLLRNPECTIAVENYYCVDVVREAIEEGREAFPRAHWFHYDRYNCSFNPTGTIGLPLPDFGVEFDFILAYSVFTHTTREEMHDLVSQLQADLAPGGALAFTFEDPHWPDRDGDNVLRRRLERYAENKPGLDVDGLVKTARRAAWCALVDGSALYVDGNGVWRDDIGSCMTYDIYYATAFMRGEFPRAEIHPPVRGEVQHCCIVRRRA